MQLLDALDDLRKQGVDVLEAGLMTKPSFSNGKHLGLSFIQQLLRIAAQGIECAAGNFIARGDQLAKNRAFPHDLGITPDIGCRRGIGGQFPKIRQAAGFTSLCSNNLRI